MSLKISTMSGKPSLSTSRWMLVGAPKIGKSLLASAWDDSLFLATEKRHAHIKGARVVEISSWDEFCIVVDQLVLNPEKFKARTIVIDTVDAAWEMSTVFALDKLGITHQTDMGYGKGWDLTDREFKSPLYKLFASQYGLILISHVKEKELISKTGSYTKTVSCLPDRARQIVMPRLSVIAHLTTRSRKVDGQDGKAHYVTERIVSVEPTDFIEAGDGDGYLPPQLPLYKETKKTYQLIKDYYEGRRVYNGAGKEE